MYFLQLQSSIRRQRDATHNNASLSKSGVRLFNDAI